MVERVSGRARPYRVRWSSAAAGKGSPRTRGPNRTRRPPNGPRASTPRAAGIGPGANRVGIVYRPDPKVRRAARAKATSAGSLDRRRVSTGRKHRSITKLLAAMKGLISSFASPSLRAGRAATEAGVIMGEEATVAIAADIAGAAAAAIVVEPGVRATLRLHPLVPTAERIDTKLNY